MTEESLMIVLTGFAIGMLVGVVVADAICRAGRRVARGEDR
jgi:ABC-type nitrate/sulfonate/bicarbonate transport system permease component